MPSGFTVSGRGDLDSLFMARVNAPHGNVGFQVAGVDVSNRYEQRGAGTAIANTGFNGAGQDLAYWYRNISEPLVTIALADFDATTYHTGGNAICQYSVRSDGEVFATNGINTMVDVGDWIAPKSAMANYSVYATHVGGTLPGGTFGAWLNLGTSRVWQLNRPTIGALVSTIDLQIRLDSSGVVQDTARITLYAERY